jgi:hypothetical protein
MLNVQIAHSFNVQSDHCIDVKGFSLAISSAGVAVQWLYGQQCC